ncbi:MAG: radical SAM protein [Candidatus Aminicenantales bacterium]
MSQAKNKDSFSHIYGPVPSRRLGFSLGIDIIPFKACSFNCIYCQLGRTHHPTIQRKEYIPSSEIITQIENTLSSGQRIDYITFSGSGEPTLNSKIGMLIRKIKKMTEIPVAVLTNSSLLYLKSVRLSLEAADLVVPSLDAASQKIFSYVNRPYPSLRIEKIIESLKLFRHQFKGSIWLEVMLVKGVNDSEDHLKKLKKAIETINPDKVQLNTVIRPPAENFAAALSLKEMEKIKKAIGRPCEIIANFNKTEQKPPAENLEEAILAIIQRRPVTLSDISASLGKHQNEIIKYLNWLLEEGKVKVISHQGLKYYEPQ